MERKPQLYSSAVERRKKVTRACDYCKKRKYRCIGKAPCDLCKKKKIPCEFSIVDRRTTKRKGSEDEQPRNMYLHRYPYGYEDYDKMQNPIQNPMIQNPMIQNPINVVSGMQNSNLSIPPSNVAIQPPPLQSLPNMPNMPTQGQMVQQNIVLPFQNVAGQKMYGQYAYPYMEQNYARKPQSYQKIPNLFPYYGINKYEAEQKDKVEVKEEGENINGSHRIPNTVNNDTPGIDNPNGEGISGTSSGANGVINNRPTSIDSHMNRPTIDNHPGTKNPDHIVNGRRATIDARSNMNVQINKVQNRPSTDAMSTVRMNGNGTNAGKVDQHNGTHNEVGRKKTKSLPPPSQLLSSTYIPKSLQPLLSFPMEEEAREPPKLKSDSESDDSGDKETHILFDSSTSARYIGESSPLSLLFEARKIFGRQIGESDFTRDPQGINIIDEPVELKHCDPVGLPTREIFNLLWDVFQSNINQSWYIFHAGYFHCNVVDRVYLAEQEGTRDQCLSKVALVHLTISLGLYFAELSEHPVRQQLSAEMTSQAFFESGFNILRKTVDDCKLWITEAYMLIHFYYQSRGNRSTSWLMLGNAIRTAQALGVHRRFINESYKDRSIVNHRRKLWVSLYVCDRISSLLLGRPLLIGDYDWDDFDAFDELVESEPHNRINLLCLIYIAKVAVINGKTVQNFYLSGKINPYRAEKLAIELKQWSMELPEDLQIHKVLNYSPERSEIGRPPAKVVQDNFSVFALHLAQLFGIMLLTRPFFMYTAFVHTRSPRKSTSEEIMLHFCRANVKASVLTISLIHFYMQQYTERVESYAAVNCCFMAALPLGLSVLHRKTDPSYEDDYTTTTIFRHLEIARKLLATFGAVSATSVRFSRIVTMMKQALMEKFPDLSEMSPDDTPRADEDYDIKDDSAANTPIEYQYENNDVMKSPLVQEFDQKNAPLESLIDFHQYFVPQRANAWSEEDLPQDVYNIGTSDILFDNNL